MKPTGHLTLRVAWHDSGWNGSVCSQPTQNSFCAALPRIRESKTDDEEGLAGREFSGLSPSELPPCKAESGFFMGPRAWIREFDHPYRQNKHCVETHGNLKKRLLKVPAYSAIAVPFNWMLRRSQKEIEQRLPDTLPSDAKPPFPSPWVFGKDRQEAIVDCPESKGVLPTQEPRRKVETEPGEPAPVAPSPETETAPAEVIGTGTAPDLPVPAALKEKETRIFHGDRGFSYRTLFLDYLRGAKKVRVEDPYIRLQHQIVNFLRFCEVCVDAGTVEEIHLTTASDDDLQKQDVQAKLRTIEDSLLDHGIKLTTKFSDTLHDRRIELDNGWHITLGRGLDLYQRPVDWLNIGANELDLRECHETTIGYRRAPKT